MHNADIIHLTEKGETAARILKDGAAFGDVRDDILGYLISKTEYKGSCEEIGMNIKALELDLGEAFDKLEHNGYIALQHTESQATPFRPRGKYNDEPLPKWVCKSCSSENIAPSTDPKSVHCANCGAKHTVTGRDIHGALYVQQFATRGDKVLE